MPELEKDVKQEDQNPSNDPAVKDSTDTSKEDESINFSDDNSRTIPYNRFREKAVEAKELKKKLAELENNKNAELKSIQAQMQSYYESEIAKIQRQSSKSKEDAELEAYYGSLEEDYSKPNKEVESLKKQVESLTATINSVRQENESSKLKKQIKSLKELYPYMSEEHVMAIHKIKGAPLEDCAEMSHKYFEDNIKARYNKEMEKKREAAKKKVVSMPTSFTLKPEERPKNFREASDKFIEFMKNSGG